MKIQDIKKYLTKNTAIVMLTTLLGIAVYGGFNISSKLADTKSELKASKVMYSLVEKEKLRLDSLVLVYNKSVKERDEIILLKDKKIKQQAQSIGVLQDSIKKSLNNVTNVSADSSYNYICLRVKPTAELKYKLDSIQIKDIHFNYLERDGLVLVNTKLIALNTNLQQLSYIKDNQIEELKLLNNVYVSKEAIYRKENAAYQIEIKGLNKTVKQQKFLKTISNGVLLGLTGYIIINTITH